MLSPIFFTVCSVSVLQRCLGLVLEWALLGRVPKVLGMGGAASLRSSWSATSRKARSPMFILSGCTTPRLFGKESNSRMISFIAKSRRSCRQGGIVWDKSDQEAIRHRVTVSGRVMKECGSHSREGSNGQLSRDRCEMFTKRAKTVSSNMLQRRRPLTVAMNCMILTKMERGMFFGNTPLCRGNRVSTTILRSLRHNERSFDTDVYTADVAHYYTVCIAEANTVYTLSCG